MTEHRKRGKIYLLLKQIKCTKKPAINAGSYV